MPDFAKLKASRAQKETKQSFVKRTQQELQSSDAHETRKRQGEPMLVDSSDIPETPEPSSVISGQLQPGGSASNDKLCFLLPPGLELRPIETRGRGIWSQTPRRKGDILLSDIPPIAVLSTRYLATHCSACFSESGGNPLKRCPVCRLVHYCDSECQTRDWPLHKQECPALQKWAAMAPQASPGATDNSEPGIIVASDAIRALGRVLWKRQKEGRDCTWAKQMDSMQSHRASLSKNEQTSQLHAHMAHALVRYLGLESLRDLAAYGIDSIAALVDLVSRFTTNAHALTSPTLTPIGVCISPNAALFNHSCEPNAALVFPRAQHNPKRKQPMLEVIAIKDIAPEEEVVVSYIDITLPRHQRQEDLKETYHFSCDCPSCSSPRGEGNNVDPREGMYCPKKCGGVCWLPTEENSLTLCVKCKSVVKDTDSVFDAIRIGQEALEKANRVQFSDPQKAIQLTENLISILMSAGCLPSSHPLLALSRLHTTLLITNFRSPFESSTIELNSPQIQEQRQVSPEKQTTLDEAQEHLDEAVRSATRTCNGLEQILPYGHPIRGLALTELAKLLSVDEPAPKHLTKEKNPPSSAYPSVTSSTSLKLRGAAQYPPSGPQRLKLSYETLVRARGELMVGFGGGKTEGGQVGQQVRKLLVDVEKELGVWKEGIKSAIADLPKAARKT